MATIDGKVMVTGGAGYIGSHAVLALLHGRPVEQVTIRGTRFFLGKCEMDRGRFGPRQDELEALAAWVASPTNAFFARAQVNRIWFHLMGRGIVDPIDDFRATNPLGNGQAGLGIPEPRAGNHAAFEWRA